MRQGWSLRLLKRLWNILVAGCWFQPTAPPKNRSSIFITGWNGDMIENQIWMFPKIGGTPKSSIEIFFLDFPWNKPSITIGDPPAIGNPPAICIPIFYRSGVARRPYMDLPPVPSPLVKSPPWIMKSCRRSVDFSEIGVYHGNQWYTTGFLGIMFKPTAGKPYVRFASFLSIALCLGVGVGWGGGAC